MNQPTRGTEQNRSLTLHRRALLASAFVSPLISASPDRAGATPAAVTPATRGALALLAKAPDLLSSPDDPFVLGSASDLKLQLDAAGVSPPAAGDRDSYQPWWRETAGLALPPPYGGDIPMDTIDDWDEAFGFDFAAFDATMFQFADGTKIVFKGSFDPTHLQSSWERSGYRRTATPHGDVWTVEPADPAVHPTVLEIERLGFRCAAFLGERTVIFGRTVDAVTATLAAASGRAPALGDHPAMAALLAAPMPALASAVALRGRHQSLLTISGVTPAAREQDPGKPPIHAVFALVAPDRATAASIVEAVEERLRTGAMTLIAETVALADLFVDVAISVSDGDFPAVVLDLTVDSERVARRPGFWMSPTYPGDLLDGIA